MAKTGFFHAEQQDGRWWLVDPEGERFISLGVNHLIYQGDARRGGGNPYGETVASKYGSEDAWAQATVERLKGWNFNTVGSFSQPAVWGRGLAYTPYLNIGGIAEPNHWMTGRFPNVFAPRFREVAAEQAEKLCAPRKDDPDVLGYFSDNELHWAPDWRRTLPVLDEWMTFAKGTPGKREMVDLLRAKYHDDLAWFNQVWGCELDSWEQLEDGDGLKIAGRQRGSTVEADRDAFLRLVAEKYFSICAAAIKKADPNHMILGARWAGYINVPVIKACRDHVDVLSFQTYEWAPPYDTLDTIYRLTDRPIMITEFSFKAMDSGHPNTWGGGRPVATQADRLAGYERYFRGTLALPYMVGLHWFQYTDQPFEGRALDGENCNYGLVKLDDSPWELLTDGMLRLNAEAVAVHAAGRP